MYFAGAMGLECSVHSASSLRSLLQTLMRSAHTVFHRYLTIGFPLSLLGVPISGASWDGAATFFVFVSFLVTLALLLGEAEMLLEQAERYVGTQERVLQVPNPGSMASDLTAMPQ